MLPDASLLKVTGSWFRNSQQRATYLELPHAGGDAEELGVAWLLARSYQRGEHSEPRLLAPTLKSEPAGILSLAAEKAAGTGPAGTGPLDRPSTGQG